MVDDKMLRAWDQAAGQYGQIGPPVFDYFAQRLLAHLALKTGEHVLDVATGTGAIALLAAKQVGPQGAVVATDLSPAMTQEAKKNGERLGLTNISYLERDAAKLDLPKESFDAVTCGFSLFLFSDMERCLQEMHRVLKPDGRLGISVWGRGAIVPHWPILGELIRKYRLTPALPNQIAWTLGDIEKLLSTSGFESVVALEERKDFWFGDENEAWGFQTSLGPINAILDQASPEKRQEFIAEYLSRIQALATPRGIAANFRVLFALATK